MVQFTFHRMHKRRNSTMRPLQGGYLTTQFGELKEPFSIEAPQIIVHLVEGFENPLDYNYVEIGQPLNRYYFIEGWTYEKGRYIADCTLDTLATWKPYIMVTQQYVERCSNLLGVDANIADGVYPVYPQIYTEFQAPAVFPWTTDPSQGTYFMGIVNNQQQYKYGCVQYYAFDHQAMLDFFSNMLGYDIEWVQVQQISKQLLKALYDPMQFITEFYWLPIPYNTITGVPFTEGDIAYGWWSLSIATSGHIKVLDTETSPFLQHTNVVAIPQHPQKDRGTYLTSAKYNTYIMYYPPFGVVELDADQIGNATFLVIKLRIDYRSRNAQIQFKITNTPNDTVGTLIDRVVIPNWGIDIPIGSITTNQSGNVYTNSATFSKGIENIISGIDIMGWKPGDWLKLNEQGNEDFSLNQVLSAQSKINAGGATVKTLGGAGSLLSYTQTAVLVHKYKLIAEQNITEIGRPSCRRLILSTIPGYIQCASADVQTIPCTYSERNTIKNHLTSGFHLE